MSKHFLSALVVLAFAAFGCSAAPDDPTSDGTTPAAEESTANQSSAVRAQDPNCPEGQRCIGWRLGHPGEPPICILCAKLP